MRLFGLNMFIVLHLIHGVGYKHDQTNMTNMIEPFNIIYVRVWQNATDLADDLHNKMY